MAQENDIPLANQRAEEVNGRLKLGTKKTVVGLFKSLISSSSTAGELEHPGFVDSIISLFIPKNDYLQSPIPRLLKCNDAPSDSDVEIIRVVISNALQQEELLSARTALTGNEVDGQLRGIWTFITQHRAILSPVRRLPPEILQKIFSYLIPERDALLRKNDPRVAVTHVSQYWRTSAIALQTLWAVLPRVTLSKHKRDIRHTTDILQEFLRRSGSAPLDVQVTNSTQDYFFTPIDDSRHPVLILLISHCERWRMLFLETFAITLVRMRSIKDRLLSLEGLHLSLMGYFAGMDTQIDTFETAPKLSEVSVVGPSHVAELSLPYNQLVKFRTHAAIYSNTPIVVMPALTKLYIHFSRAWPNVEYWFDSVALPALEDAFFAVYSETGCCQVLSSIINRSSTPCRLKSLRVLVSNHDLPGDLPALLALTPELEMLEADALWASDIDALSYLDSPSVLVPKLTRCTFFIDCSDTYSPIPDAISRLAFSRCHFRRNEDIVMRGWCSIQLLRIYARHSHTYLSGGSSANRHGVREPFLTPELFEALPTEPVTPTAAKLHDLRSRLLAELTEPIEDKPSGPKLTDFGWRRRIGDILNEIEEIDVVNAHDILRTNIHRSLQKLDIISKRHLPSLQIYRAQIERILQQWLIPFSAISNQLHWIFEKDTLDPMSVIYICSNHAVRFSSKNKARIFLRGFSEKDIGVLFKHLPPLCTHPRSSTVSNRNKFTLQLASPFHRL